MRVLLLVIILHINSIRSFEELASDCSTGEKLQVIPGRGWDSLTNTEMRQVLKMTYNACKTTLDGKFLIPDHVEAIPVSETTYDISSEFVEHWTNFTSVTSQSFKTNAGGMLEEYFLTLHGSFSREYEKVKKHQVEERASLIRVYFKTTAYALRTSPKEISADLHKMLNNAIHALENGNDERANGQLEFVVRDYGTHVLTKADSGAILLKEDYIAMKNIHDHWTRKSAIAAAAKVDFIHTFRLTSDFKDEKFALAADEYKKMRISTSTRAVGGLFTPGMTLQQWIDQVGHNFVTIDRSGDPLSFVITPYIFPDASVEVLQKLRKRLDNAILRYYSINTHYGCTKINSENFDYSANVDDGSCDAPSNNYTFGGLYQTCNPLLTDAGNLCNDLAQVNPLTGGFSCPIGYTNTPLHAASHQITKSNQKCNEKCSGWWLWKKCRQECSNEYPTSTAAYSSHWCVSDQPVRRNTGFMFGGLYSHSLSNPVTRAKTCPPHFTSIVLSVDLNVCISSDYETGFKFSIPFGGFFSCTNGNPLSRAKIEGGISSQIERMKALRIAPDSTDHVKVKSSHYEIDSHGCPSGYSQHSAGIHKGCQVNYCVKAAIFGTQNAIPIVRPPFGTTDALFALPNTKKSWDSISPLNVGIIVSLSLLLLLIITCIAFYYQKKMNYSSAPTGGKKIGAQISSSLGQIRSGLTGIRSAVFAGKV